MYRGLAVSTVLMFGLGACGSDPTVSGVPSPTESTSTLPAAEITSPTIAPPMTAPDVVETTPATDRADAYLAATTELYRRPLPDGHDFVVRLSTESYASVFGLVWNAPTGTAEKCLGDRALFLGVPGVIGWWGSAWTADKWFDEPTTAQPAELQASMMTADNPNAPAGYLVVRINTAAAEVVLSASDGTEVDRARVANGIAMVVMPERALGEGETVNNISVVVVAADGQQSAPLPLTPPERTTSPECGPGEQPVRSLPAAGVQPADSTAATAQIRQRYALLVDRSIPADQKPSDLLDDYTGVQAAIAGMDRGQYADVAASATYAIDELVFTSPDEAWFRYTITTSASTWPDRFGQAHLNGGIWQITRATVCQDLALAQSACNPNPLAVVPPDPGFDAAWQEWVSRAMLYSGNDGCPPLSQC